MEVDRMSNELISDELKGKSGIYKIINLVNDKIYIGSSVNLKQRKSEHFRTLREKSHKNQYLQSTFNKYGIDNFKFEVVEYVNDINKLIKREQYYLDIYFDKQNKCYNISPTAGSPLGVKYNDEMKLQSAISKGAKPFYVFKDREFVGEWINSVECSKNLDINYSGYIRKCLNGKRHISNGYVFIYKDEYNEDKLNEIYEKFEGRPFLVFNKYIKELVGEYNFQYQCVNELKIYKWDVSSCLRGESYSAKDYIFIYKDEYTNEKLNELCIKCNRGIYRKQFYVYNKNTRELIGEFDLQLECAKKLNIAVEAINACLNLSRKMHSVKNYIFIYVEDYSEEKLNELYNKSKSRYVFEVYNKFTNEYINTYDNQTKCAKDLKISNSSVNNCVNGKTESVKGYIFKKVS